MDERGNILIVDDLRTNRLKIAIGLKKQGYRIAEAENGRQALEMLRAQTFDLVLLDILMPELNGYEVLEEMKNDSALRSVPVIVISAQDELESVVRGIELGAEDYLPKNFDPVLLRARIGASLEKKRLRDQEQAYLREIQLEREKSERLLLNILPAPIAERLKQREEIIADSFEQASVMFIDIVSFTKLSSQVPAAQVVLMLNEVFSTFDALTEKYRLEKIKTSGDSYLVVGGLPVPKPDHLEAIAEMALDVLTSITKFHQIGEDHLQLRIGIHTGLVEAGVIGKNKFIYDIWGDTVNIASRMETTGLPGTIQVTETVYQLLAGKYRFESRGEISVKGKGPMNTYMLVGRN